MIDVDPLKLRPTWRNMKIGEDKIEKRIDHFLVSESFVDGPFQFCQWVGNGGESNHFPIFLEVVGGPQKPPNPFKFNSEWLKHEGFIKLVKEKWRPFNHESSE
jgi:hypothetical protein